MRIAKYISNSGYCSRRDAEKLITNGKVYLNDNLCNKVNINVNESDKITIDKKIIKLEKKIRLWKFYKPIKTICTNKDPRNRKTIFDLMPKNLPRIISIGRLDFMSEGLLLLTNNGDFARKIELPASNVLRVYRLYVKGKVDNIHIKKINKGISVDGIHYKKIYVNIEKVKDDYTILIFKLTEGKNREIRKICNFLNLKIIKLIRIQYGSIKLSKQKIGVIEEIKNIPNFYD